MQQRKVKLHVVLDDTLQINEEHKKQRIEAMQNVQVLPYLSEQSKQGYLEQIKNAPSKEEMDSVVANASMEYYQNILKWNAARSEIENLNELTSAERNTFLNEISRTQHVDQLSEIVQRAKNLANERANTQQDLATAKQNAKDSLDKLTALTDVQKAEYAGQLDQATSKEAIAAIVKQAQDDNAQRLAEEEASQAELAKAKAAAKATITGLASLPEASKVEYAGQLDKATSKEAIAAIVKQAQDDNEDVKDYTADNTGASGDGQHQQGRLQTHTKNVGATISKSLQNLPQTNENQDSEEDTEKEKVSTNKKQKANDSQDNKISQSTTKEVMEEKKENKNTFVKIFSVLVAGLVSGWFFIMKKKSKK